MTRVRIKDIARLASVSTGTVDRVIHKRSGVSEVTRKRTQKIIEEYDYQPDIIAGALASGKEFRFLVCMPAVVNAHAFWKFPESGVKKALDEMGHFDVQVEYLRFDQHSILDFQEVIADINPEEYDGLLFAPVFSDVSSKFIDRWTNAGKPCILFNSKIEGGSQGGFIGQDAFQSGYLGGKLMSYGLPFGKDLLILNLSLRKDNYLHIIKRERGFRSFFEEHNDRINNLVTLNINDSDYAKIAGEIEKKMQEMNIAGLFVTNSRVHMAARFLAERGSLNIRLIGYDLISESIDYLKREYIDFLISQSPEEQAYMGLKQHFYHVVLKKELPGDLLMPIDILTKENIEYYLKFNKENE
ncbi:MAG: substrate-binding domain-containing protein [Bacteroidales bacterium]|jgi:LacI family transcriptional regulator|nr:substrate-binding domain-containing protein [Bacteroidales bacterium]